MCNVLCSNAEKSIAYTWGAIACLYGVWGGRGRLGLNTPAFNSPWAFGQAGKQEPTGSRLNIRLTWVMSCSRMQICFFLKWKKKPNTAFLCILWNKGSNHQLLNEQAETWNCQLSLTERKIQIFRLQGSWNSLISASNLKMRILEIITRTEIMLFSLQARGSVSFQSTPRSLPTRHCDKRLSYGGLRRQASLRVANC